MLLRYELQKIFCKRTNKIVLLLLAALIAYACRSAMIQVEWVDNQGNSITGHSAAAALRADTEAWSGTLNQTMLEKALAEIKAIYASTEVDTQTQESNYLLRSKLQGAQEIADLLSLSFQEEYDTFEEMLSALQPEDISQFYANRIESRKAWLYTDETSWGYYNYTPAEKQYLLEKYEALETPLEIGYHEGWVQANGQISTLLKYGIILLSFLLAGIFSDDFSLKSDAVYFATRYGRTKAAAVKMAAGFLVITGIYWLCVGTYSLIVLGSLGTDGADCLIQSHAAYWNVRENITFLQKYALTIASGYIGYLFAGFLVMWISSVTKSPVLAVLIPSLLMLLPEFLWNFYSPAMRRIIGVLPDKLLDTETALQYLYLYTIGNRVYSALPILIMVYPCMTAALVLACYCTYRHEQLI